ncbi:putative pentatricopeptide repeat-containing protein [Acorus calamus]|uniref:Pentatricopeptide repeat-containing protein n=1 Tax=Acorus calamus TaxID=4465 RepID=A0AAV9E7B4_ACOCL|nr:putative pentatricopeptide repeat-containing protein [Acorus calamus]
MFSNMLYVDLVPPDLITLSIAIKSCVAMRELLCGKIVHFHVLVNGFHSDLHLVAGLIDLHLKCDRTDDARKVFDAVSVKDAFVWTVMIDGCLRSWDSEDALILFAEMRAAGVRATSVTWTTLMAGFARMGLVSDILYMLHQMQLEGVRPENVCVCSILPAFSESAILKPGKEAHAYSIRMCFDSDLFMASAHVDMNAKCGNLDSAFRLFTHIEVKDTGLWNSIIVGHAIHGRCADALGLFDSMCDSGVRPNEITFTSVLSACSHAGEVDEGYRIFRSMVIEYGIVACHEHYACVVDLLARGGRLEEAYEIIQGMPARPMEDIWGAFLSACRTHSNSKLAMLMEEHIVSPENVSAEAGCHVVMLDIYAGNGRWRDVARLRTRIRDRGLKKKTGFSWIEIGDMVHTFHKADVSHPKSDQIYALLESLEAVNASVKASQMDSFLQREEAVLLC